MFKRLLVLRVFLLLACLALILGAGFFPDKDINTSLLLMVLVAVSAVSLWAWFRHSHHTYISDWLLVRQLLLDSCLVIILVWFSGRSTNPFIYYMLVIIAVSASIFPPRILWSFSAGGIAIYTFLIYLDFNEHLLHMPRDFQLHLLGMWLNFVGSALLISFFISRLTTALRDRERLLAAAREETLKNEQLIGIGTLAASTVHSLGTPLSTIAVSLGELQEQHNDPESQQYLTLIQTQIERCKKIMSKLSLLANSDSLNTETYTVTALLEDIREYFLLVNANPQPQFDVKADIENLPVPGNFLLKHALINLIDNAVHAAVNEVFVVISVEDQNLTISIEDDGDGIPREIAENLGKPINSSKEEGLGIGIFLANSTIEKLNGKVRFYSADRNLGKRTQVIVEIPVSRVEE